MGWEVSVYTGLSGLAAALAAGTAAVLWRGRPRSGAMALSAVVAAIGLWSVAQVALVSATTGVVVYAGLLLTLLAGVGLTVCWTVFALQYTGNARYVTARTVAAALVVPAVAVGLALTNDPVGPHEVMVRTLEFQPGTGTRLEYDLGPGAWLLALYAWALAAVGTGALAVKAARSRNVYRKRSALLVLVGLAVLASTVSSVVGIDPFPHFSFPALVFLALSPVVIAVTISDRVLSVLPLESVLRTLGPDDGRFAPMARDTIIEELDIGVLVVDGENRVVDLNPIARSILGAERRIVGQPLTEVVEPAWIVSDDRTFLRPAVTDARLSAIWVDRPDGDRRCYDVRISGVTVGGTPVGRVILVSDVTERERHRTQLEARAAELARQNRQLEDFAHVVSHDLRNPVNVASGYLDLARTEGDPAHFDRVETALERIESLIDGVLSLVRQGKTIEETEAVDLAALAGEAWQHVDTGEATLTLADERPVEADASRLLQLFENLFRNAIDHAGEAATVTVGTTTDGFYVEDDGPGIPADRREAVFEKGVTGTEEGTGLGLAIVATIVEAHGWAIDATEGSDGGARFEVTTAASDDPEPVVGLSDPAGTAPE